MADLDELERLAARAGSAARDEARARHRRMDAAATATARSRRRLLGGLGAVTAAVVAVALVVQFGPAPGPVIDPIDVADTPPPSPGDGTGLLPIPEVGDAIATYLDDGTPVFVSHPAEGELVVLDPAGHPFPQLVSFCPSSGWFTEYPRAGQYNGWGDYVGGPAATAMAAYPHELVTTDDGGRAVRVTGPVGAPPERTERRGGEQRPAGPACASDEGRAPDADERWHRPPDDVPTLRADQLPQGRWVWARVAIVGPVGQARICDPDLTCPPDAPQVGQGWDWVMSDRLIAYAPRTMLVRVDGDVARTQSPANWVVINDGEAEAASRAAYEGPWILPVSEEPDAEARYLEDGTPVFVVHHDDGEVEVLEAIAPSTGVDLVGWCVGSDAFVTGDGTAYAADGAPLGADGPALRKVPTEAQDFHGQPAVEILGRPEARDLPAATGSTTGCDDPVVHDPGAEVASGGPWREHGEWSWGRAALALVDDTTYLCSPDQDRCPMPPDLTYEEVCLPDGGSTPTYEACSEEASPVVIGDGLDAAPAAEAEPEVLLLRQVENAVQVVRPHPAAITTD